MIGAVFVSYLFAGLALMATFGEDDFGFSSKYLSAGLALMERLERALDFVELIFRFGMWTFGRLRGVLFLKLFSFGPCYSLLCQTYRLHVFRVH